jgi:DNA-binding NarL/FixJ family response regulator
MNTKNIIETVQLEYDKSAFLIDLVQHRSGNVYVEIVQTIHDDGQSSPRTIKINPTVLSDLIHVLERYRDQLQAPSKTPASYNYLSDQLQEEIEKRYLKGIDPKDIALQTDLDEDTIESVLRNKGLFIIKDQRNYQYDFAKNRRRKRRRQ